MTSPRIRFTVEDYMTTPPERRYQLLDGELIVAPAPTDRHQAVVVELLVALHRFVTGNRLGHLRVSPYDVVLSDYDVVQPDILFVSNGRSGIITEANIQGAPDLVVEVLSSATAQNDRGYKRTLYGRSGVLEYWLVDPDVTTVEVLSASEEGLVSRATYHRGETLDSPLLAGLSIDLGSIFT